MQKTRNKTLKYSPIYLVLATIILSTGLVIYRDNNIKDAHTQNTTSISDKNHFNDSTHIVPTPKIETIFKIDKNNKAPGDIETLSNNELDHLRENWTKSQSSIDLENLIIAIDIERRSESDPKIAQRLESEHQSLMMTYKQNEISASAYPQVTHSGLDEQTLKETNKQNIDPAFAPQVVHEPQTVHTSQEALQQRN